MSLAEQPRTPVAPQVESILWCAELIATHQPNAINSAEIAVDPTRIVEVHFEGEDNLNPPATLAIHEGEDPATFSDVIVDAYRRLGIRALRANVISVETPLSDNISRLPARAPALL